MAIADIFFQHHSTGRNLISQGGMVDDLNALGYDLWSYDYNDLQVKLNDVDQGIYPSVPNNDTDYPNWSEIWSDSTWLADALSHEVVILKACFPNSDINDATELSNDETEISAVRTVADANPSKLFIILTQPPLLPVGSGTPGDNAYTDAACATRARTLASWMVSSLSNGRDNLVVFDLFDQLANANDAETDPNCLKSAYRLGGDDAHPNGTANAAVGPVLVIFIDDAIAAFDTPATIVTGNPIGLLLALTYTVAGGSTYEDALALARTAGISQINNIIADAGISLARTNDSAPGNVITGEAGLTLAQALAIAQASQLDANNALTLGTILTVGLIGGLNVEDALTLARTMDIAAVNIITKEDALTLARSLGITQITQLDAVGTLPLGKIVAVTQALQLEGVADLALARRLAAAFTNVANLNSAVSLGLSLSAVMVANVFSGGLVTPAARVYVIPGENRVLVIDAENRIYVIDAENRTFEI